MTGSHEDTVWSLQHQFNDVPDFFPLFLVFPAPLTTIVRESGRTAFHITNEHLRTCRRPSLCCWLHTQERGNTVFRELTWCTCSLRNGPYWHSGSHYVVLCSYPAIYEALLWTAALESWGLRFFCEKDLCIFVVAFTLCGLYASGKVLIILFIQGSKVCSCSTKRCLRCQRWWTLVLDALHVHCHPNSLH